MRDRSGLDGLALAAAELVENPAGGQFAHDLHGLADGSEIRRAEPSGRDIIEPDDGAIVGNAQAGAVECADAAQRGEVIEGDDGSEWLSGTEEVFGLEAAAFESRVGVDGFGQLADSFPLIQSGKLRAIAVLGNKRMAVLPDVPWLWWTMAAR